MSSNDRNVDTGELSDVRRGNTARTGTGARETHRREAERDTEDRQMRGIEGRQARRDRDIADALLEPDTDEPMTSDQAEHLRILCQEAGEPFEPALNKSQAERRIHDLQRRAGFKP